MLRTLRLSRHPSPVGTLKGDRRQGAHPPKGDTGPARLRVHENRAMFAPSQEDVRRFFCDVWHRRRHGLPLDPMQAKLAGWIDLHPEYDGDLSNVEVALAKVYAVEDGRTNPFLHLGMHLSLTEQVEIDQPTGIRSACEQLSARLGSLHEAHHQMMECLGRMVWESQRSGLPPDGHQYLDCVRRAATRLPGGGAQ